MMAKIQMKFGDALIAFDADDPKMAIERAHYFAEAFDVKACGQCGSVSLRPEVRVAQDNKFYGWRCMDCNAQLDLGQHKGGKTLFQKRSSDKDDREQHGGWYVFRSGEQAGQSQEYREPRQTQVAPQGSDDEESKIPF